MIGILLLIISIFLFNRKKFYASLMLFFLFATNGFQLVPVNWLMMGSPLDKGTDLAVLYVLFISFTKFNKVGFILHKNPIYKWCLYLLFFSTVSAFYSYLILEYPLTNIIQVYRQYLIFIGFVVFFFIPLPILKKIFHSLAIITLIQSCLFLLQIVTGKLMILAMDGSDKVITTFSGDYVRYYNTPAFLVPTLYYFLFVYKFKKDLFFYFTIIILFLTVIGPMHRSSIIAVVAVLLVYAFFKKGRSIYITGIGILIVIGSFIDIVNERMSEAYMDILATFNSNLNLNMIDAQDNNVIYRVAHFLERYNYISDHYMGWLFGIGLISDNSPLASRLPFKTGLTSEITGQVAQVDTGDLSYSLLILTLGVVGTILYLFVFIRFLIYFFKNFRDSNYGIIGFLTILNVFFLSMAGTEMLSFTFRIIVLLLSVIVCKQIILTKKYKCATIS